MVLRGALRYGVQQLAQRAGPRIQNYVKQEYGQIAGSIVGGAIGIVAGGDFYSAINKGLGGDKPPNDRTPPFGYYEKPRNGPVNGPTNGAFNKALYSTKSGNRRRRRRVDCSYCDRRRSQFKKPRFRGRRRF